MIKKSKVAAATLLVTSLLVGSMGCGKTETKTAETDMSKAQKEADVKEANSSWPEENTLPITTGDVELVIYTYIKEGAQQVYKDLSEHPVVKQMSAETGIKFTFIHPPEGDDGTFFNTMIASGVYPDIIDSDFKSYPGGVEAAIEDGVLLNMTELVNQYGYYYNQLLTELGEEGDSIRKKVVSDDGKILYFGSIIQGDYLNHRVHNGLIIREDLLKKHNMDMPVTIDDYEKVLQMFKEEGIKTPLALPTITDGQWERQNIIASAFGITHDQFYVNDVGKVVYARTQTAFKDYVTLLNKWYQLGYITSDFTNANNSEMQKQLQGGNAGIAIGGAFNPNSWNIVGQATNPDFWCVGSPYPRVNADDEVKFANDLHSIDGSGFFISATCEHPVEAMKFLDYLYKPETRFLSTWGPGSAEYPTYEMKDGIPCMTEFMTGSKDYNLSIAKHRFTGNNWQIMYDDEMQRQQYEPYPEKMGSWENWANNTSAAGLLPSTISQTVEEASEINTIMNAIDTYSDEMMMKYIVGTQSLDTFDEFAATIEGMGIARAVELKQAALDRYNAR